MKNWRQKDGTLKPVKWQFDYPSLGPRFKTLETIIGEFYVKRVYKMRDSSIPAKPDGRRPLKWIYGKTGDKEPMGETPTQGAAQAEIENHYRREAKKL